MKENKPTNKIKHFGKYKYNNFIDWSNKKEHPNSVLNKTAFFYDSLKLIGLILFFLIIYYNLDKLNQIILIFIKIGSLTQLILLLFILRKASHLTINLKYAFRGLNNGAKTAITIIIVVLIFIVFLNQDVVINSIMYKYAETNFTKLNPIQTSGNFSLIGLNSSKIKLNPLSGQEKNIIKVLPCEDHNYCWFRSCSTIERNYASRNIDIKSNACKEICGDRNLEYSSNECEKDKLICYCLNNYDK